MAGVLSTAMIATLVPSIPSFAVNEDVPGSFDLVTQVYSHGQEVKAVVIDTAGTVNASDIDSDTFAVSTTNLNPQDDSVVYEGARAITNVYVSNDEIIDGEGDESGRYIILELETGFEVEGSSTLIYTGGYNIPLTLNYEVTQQKDYSSFKVGDIVYTQDEIINEVEDDFAYGVSEASGYEYRFFSPDVEDGEQYPLVVWLHGAGERGADVGTNCAQLRANRGAIAYAEPQNQAAHPAYVLAPQAKSGWDGQKVVDLVNEIVSQNPSIDPSRIYISGCSMGGMGTWSTILTDPTLFAAAITCPGGSNESAEVLSAVKDLPIWMVQTGQDTYAATKAAFETLTSIGGNIKWTHFEVGGNGYPNDHWSWVPTSDNFYSEEYGTNVFDWLFSQKNTTNSYELVTETYSYGNDVKAVVIDTKSSVDAADVSADKFAVSATNINPTDDSVVYEGARNIVDAYVSNDKVIDGEGDASGRYIILELEVGFQLEGASTLIYNGINIPLTLNYTIEQLEDVGSITVDGAKYVQGATINEVVDEFEYKTSEASGYNYRMFTPDKEDGQKYPLVLWLHGGGEKGLADGTRANEAQLLANRGAVAYAEPQNQAERPCYVVAPQTVDPNRWEGDKVLELVDELINENPDIDTSRIYISGCSMGGAGTWSTILLDSSPFAAALLCPGGNTSDAEAMMEVKDLPIWMLQTGEDTLEATEQAYNTLVSIGADVKWSHLPSGANGYPNDHWSWVPTVNNYYSEEYGISTFDWLFSQRNDKVSFDVVSEVFEYGQDTVAIVIDAKQDVNASDVSIDSFEVNTTNINPFNDSVAFEGEREITNVYVSDTKDADGEAVDSGRYIVLELKHGFTVKGATALVYQGVNKLLDMNFEVTQLKDVGSIPAGTEYKMNNEYTKVVDEFAYGEENGTRYRIYTPDEAENGEPLPLVLWNHGAGESYRESADNEGVQLRANMGGVGWVQDEYPSYVLAPQQGTGYAIDNVIAVIDRLIDEGKVDPDRVYVSGCSMGGGQTLTFLRTYPGYFAAAVPICPAGSYTDEQAATVADTPMWFFHSADDPTINVSRTRATVAQLEGMDPVDLKYTEVEHLPYEEEGGSGNYNGHWSWILPLNNYYSEEYGTNVFDWLFAQENTKGDFELVTETYDYGNDVKAVVIDTKTQVNGSSIDVDTFTVSTTNLSSQDNSVVYEGERKVVNAYVSNDKVIDGEGEITGRYIILELEVGFGVDGASSINYANSINTPMILNYEVTQQKDITVGANTLTAEYYDYENVGTINELVDEFAYVTSEASGYEYRLFTPEKEAGKEYPLVIWLHGAGEKSLNGVRSNEAQLLANRGALGYAAPEVQEKYPSYVVAPQTVSPNRWEADRVVALVKELIAEYPDIDTSRIYISGCSMGGSGTWSTILAAPELFAAAIMAPGGSTESAEVLSAVKDLPIWMFNTGEDTLEATEAAYNTLTSIGGDVKWTHLESGANGYPNDHWVWVRMAQNYYSEEYQTSVFAWLFSQRKADLQTDVLGTLIDLAEQAKADGALVGVVEAVVDMFNDALANANSVYHDAISDQPTVSQDTIDAAAEELATAMQYLEFKGDKTALKAALELAAQYVDNKDAYIPSTYVAFERALNAAQAVMDDPYALNDEIDAAFDDLMEGIAGLRLTPNKDALRELIDRTNSLNRALFTAQSLSIVDTAYATALAVFNDEEATEKEVLEAQVTLAGALDNLQAISDDQGSDNNDDQDSDNGNDDQNVNDGQDNDQNDSSKPSSDVAGAGTGSTGSTSANNQKDNVFTGDNAPIALAVSLLMLGGVAFLASKKRRSK